MKYTKVISIQNQIGDFLSRIAFPQLWMLITFFIFYTYPSAFAQENQKFKEFALGYSIVHERLPEGYNYTPLFFNYIQTVYSFSSKKNARLSILFEPQFVINDAPQNFPTTFEFGVNLGFQYYIPLSSKNALRLSIGVGPHYLSLDTEIQAKGFIFSDNFEVGYYQRLTQQWYLGLKTRFRHLSNAGLQSPNIGVDNFFFMLGINRQF